jgi:hypothetical protein
VDANLRVFLEDIEQPILGGLEVFSGRLGEVVFGNLFDNRVEVGLVESHEIDDPSISLGGVSSRQAIHCSYVGVFVFDASR